MLSGEFREKGVHGGVVSGECISAWWDKERVNAQAKAKLIKKTGRVVMISGRNIAFNGEGASCARRSARPVIFIFQEDVMKVVFSEARG